MLSYLVKEDAMSTASTRKFTPEEYLALERTAKYKSQYYRGEIFAMPGGTLRHGMMSASIIRILGNQLLSRPCSVYSSDTKVMVEETGLMTYPDVVVACMEQRFHNQEKDVLLNPTVLIEVLSPSTELYDRGTKSEHYRKIPSLQEYILIAQDRIHIEQFTRSAEGHWTFAEVDQPGQILRLESIACDLSVDDVYAKVQFTPESS
jgi:Uma2 family endonuclease